MVSGDKKALDLIRFSESDYVDEALKEWRHTGRFYDFRKLKNVCRLCGRTQLRYLFEIKNIHNHQAIFVGPECIELFDIDPAVLTRGPDTTKADSKQLLVYEQRKQRMIQVLVSLKKHSTDFDIDSFIHYVMYRDAFTPEQLSLLFWQLSRYEIAYRESDFKVILKRKREQEQLKNMAYWKIRRIWKALSTDQQKWVMSHTQFRPWKNPAIYIKKRKSDAESFES